MNLSATQKRYLRGMGHSLHPIITVGNKGLTDALLKEFDLSLDQHELVKVKLGSEDRDLRKEQIAALGKNSRAEIIHTIGKVACYFRRNQEKPRINLPK